MIGRFIDAAGLEKLAMGTIICVGLFNSVMFPSIFALGVEGLGPLTAKGSGLLVQAIVGGGIMPLAEGALADRIGIHRAFILPALCYIYIAYYGYRGSVQKAASPAVAAS